MFNVGGGEVVVLLLLALLLLGPEKLPEASRKVGKFLAEVRRVTSGFEEEVRSAMDMGPGAKVVDLLDTTTSGPTLTGPTASPTAPDPADHGSGPSRGGPDGGSTAFVADLASDPRTDDDPLQAS